MSAKTAKKARQADVEQAMVEQAQPVIVTDVAAQEDATPEQAMPLPTRRSSAARFMADLLKPIANRVAAQTPKAHLWELIKFLNAVDHGNADCRPRAGRWHVGTDADDERGRDRTTLDSDRGGSTGR